MLAFPVHQFAFETLDRQPVPLQAQEDVVRDVLFGAEDGREKAVVVDALDAFPAAEFLELLQDGVVGVLVFVGEAQVFGRAFQECSLGEENVPVACRFLQGVKDGRFEPDRAILREAYLGRNFVCLDKADAVDVFAEHVGVVLDAADGVLPVLGPELFGDAPGDVVLVQEQHGFPAVTVLLPAGEEQFGLLCSQSLDFRFAECVRLVVEDVGCPVPECGYDAGRRLGANSRKKPAREVRLDAAVFGREDFKPGAYELRPEFRMPPPIPRKFQRFPRRKFREIPGNHHDLLGLGVRQSHDCESVLRIVEGDCLYAAGENHCFDRGPWIGVVDYKQKKTECFSHSAFQEITRKC